MTTKDNMKNLWKYQTKILKNIYSSLYSIESLYKYSATTLQIIILVKLEQTEAEIQGIASAITYYFIRSFKVAGADTLYLVVFFYLKNKETNYEKSR